MQSTRPSREGSSLRGDFRHGYSLGGVLLTACCVSISGGAFAMAVLHEPGSAPLREQTAQQQAQDANQSGGRTVILRGTNPPGADENANDPDTLAHLRSAVESNQLSLEEFGFALSAIGGRSSQADDGARQGDAVNDHSAWIREWLTGDAGGLQFLGGQLDAAAADSFVEFFDSQIALADAQTSGTAEEQEQAAQRWLQAADESLQAMRAGFRNRQLTADQLVVGLNWVLEARLGQAEVDGQNAESAAINATELQDTLTNVAELYRATQAGTDASAFIKARYYHSRAWELLARQSGNNVQAGIASKHAMQHSLARYRMVLASAPLSQQNLLELTEAAENRAHSLLRYAEARGDRFMHRRAMAELQASTRMIERENARRGDAPRNRVVAQILNGLNQKYLR